MSLGEQAYTGIFPSADSPKVGRAPLELVKCDDSKDDQHCGLVQLKHSFSPSDLYGAHYGYRSGLNTSMVEHLKNKVQHIEGLVSIDKDDLIIDIGANDGTTLGSYTQQGQSLLGIDPSAEKFRKYYASHVDLIVDFFSKELIEQKYPGRKAKVITSFAMFYDLEKPLDFVREIESLLAKDGIWVFEQSYLPSMLRTNSYDTICHEHLEYYILKNIKWMLDRAGLRIVDISLNNVNGGSFSVIAAKASNTDLKPSLAVTKMLQDEKELGLSHMKVYEDFKGRVEKHREDLKALVAKIESKNYKLFGYGASTKGNVLLQYCGLDSQHLQSIADVNPDKFGCVTPGTRIPIESEADAKLKNPDFFIVLPWHFKEGIIKREVDFIRKGGGLIFPLPELQIVGGPEL